MAIDINSVKFLIAARKHGCSFGRVLTLGRQELNVYPRTLQKLFHKHGLQVEMVDLTGPERQRSEILFKILGAAEVCAIDKSEFEGAEIVHDLNMPIKAAHHRAFDLVYDGGTLEHVFHFPMALQNAMEMVRAGGHLIIHTVANNYFGHGFYQFSPELFYRVLCPGNGFEVQRMVAHPMGPYGRWHEVRDPKELGARVELVTWYPLQLLIQARCVRAVRPFEQAPQQSDFVPRWNTARPGLGAARNRLADAMPGLARFANAVRTGWRLLRRHSWKR
jgi:SAM-dependent methyltransferase